MTDFTKFRDAVATQFDKMVKNGNLYRVNMKKDALWDKYLASFPEGTNPIFRERTEHDCNCCKNFIRDVGNVVAIRPNNTLMTIWDIKVDNFYQEVADEMSKKVSKAKIKAPFLHDVKGVGVLKNPHQLESGDVISFNHFRVEIPKNHVMKSDRIASTIGEKTSDYDVLKRSVEEITDGAVEIVLELIEQNSIYRGSEYKPAVRTLKKVKAEHAKAKSAAKKDAFLWKTAGELGGRSRVRNTAIGTLLTDISEGVELERAVKSFEDMVAPQNYKRSSALITQGMVDKAEKKVQELGLQDSLQRRYATEQDLTVNNVLFVDQSVKSNMKGGAFDGLLDGSVKKGKAPSYDKVDSVGIEEFIQNILPKADTLEVYVENKHTPNMMSVIAPVHEDAPNILKWDNMFSWSYNGEVTDSIKERVKSAGGNVTGDVRASLSWYNYDDLDIHVQGAGGHIFFGSKRGRCGGTLDVDMNAGGRKSREPVENIFWKTTQSMIPGVYDVYIDQFSHREKSDVGFELEFDIGGEVMNFHYPKEVKNQVKVLTFEVDKQKNVKVVKTHIEHSTASKEVWGISTENFQKVNMVMLSPNHWDGQQVGNKHWFFILDQCKNPDKARGLYNEFMRNDLHEHRKVFEVLGSKIKAPESDQQLSGLGFSSTKENVMLCRVGGSFNRVLKVTF